MWRRRVGGLLGLAAGLAAAGCGSSQHLADQNRPATTINATVYIDNTQVSVSPSSVGAGPVQFYVTNDATHSETLNIADSAGGGTLASTPPINPGLTAQVEVDFTHRGRVTFSTSGAGAAGGGIRPATLSIGAPRPPGNNALLQP